MIKSYIWATYILEHQLLYLLQVVGNVDDLLVRDADSYLDQLPNHSCLSMDNGQVQRPIEEEKTMDLEQVNKYCSQWAGGHFEERVKTREVDVCKVVPAQDQPTVPDFSKGPTER